MGGPLQLYRSLPLRERLFVRARWSSAPLQALADRSPLAGRIADIGCGHGVLTAALALGHPERQVLGVDPDPWKIGLATRALGSQPNVELRVGTVESLLPELEGALEAIAVADVLYLLPAEDWP